MNRRAAVDAFLTTAIIVAAVIGCIYLLRGGAETEVVENWLQYR